MSDFPRPFTELATRSMDRRVWVVVPAFNEETIVGETVRGLLSRFPDVVVVDDGSQDRTAEQALAAGAVVVRHAVNLGQGASLQTGMQYALSRGAEYVATFDADGQHGVDDLERMVNVLRERRLDIVLGSRFLGRATGMPRARRLVLRLATVLTRFTTGVPLTDAHNGLRVMTAGTARRFHLVQDDMAHASEFVAQIGRLGLRYAEVPVTVAYTRYSIEKGQRLTNGARILGDLLVGWLLR